MRILLGMLGCVFSLQATCQNFEDGFLHIEMTGLENRDLDSLVLNNDTLNQLFADFSVTSVQVSWPGAKSATLRKVFEVHLDGDANALRDTLQALAMFNNVVLCDYYVTAGCTNPLSTNDPYVANAASGNVLLSNTDQHLVLMDAYCAWTITKGSPDIIVGVVDTEFDINHEDLEGQILSVSHNNSVHAHGTSVAGCVAAIPNNNVGIAGIGYHTKVKGYTTANYNPVEAGLDVVNIWPLVWQAYTEEVNVSWVGIGNDYTVAAIQGITESGIVITTSAGNNPNAVNHAAYADIPGVINVSGVDADNFHGPTNHAHNQWVDICVMSKNVSMLLPSNQYTDIGSATSQAAPQIAGLAALIFSVNPCLTAGEVETIIKQSADPIADEADFPGLLGAGRANAYQALLLAVDYAGCEVHDPIYESTVWDTPRCVYGDLIIESGATLTITDEVTFSQGAKVTVHPDAALIIDGGHLTSASICENEGFWQGIEVLGTANQPQLSQYQGRVIMRNGGTIENATLGVSLGVRNENGTPDLSTTGGYLLCSTGARFVNCKQAVQTFDYYSSITNKTKFYNTTFEINDDWLFEEEIPGYQVVLRGVNNIKFQGCDFVNNRSDAFSILDAGKGIASANSGFHVTNCHFENLELGIGVKSFGFDDIKIANNTFIGNLGGVSLRYSGLAEVVENTFVVSDPSDLNWPEGEAADIPFGLYIGGSTGYEVKENLFYSSNIHKNVGLAIRNSGNFFNQIGFNNEFHTLEVGALAMGDNRFDPAEGALQATGLVFRCNDFGIEVGQDTYLDLNYAIALTDEGEIAMHQGVISAEIPGAGNRFYPECPPATTDREFYVDESTPELSYHNYIPFAQPETRPDCNTGLPYIGVMASVIPFVKEEHCPSDLSSNGVIDNFRERYYQNKAIYNALLEVYKDTVNGGDTQFLLDLIEDEFVSSFNLRNELLLASPRVTDRVLIAAIERNPAMNPWHIAQVLLANSPLPQNVLTALSRSDFDDYYIELVEDGQNGGVSHTMIMESELAYFDGLKEAARMDFVRQAFRQDSTLALNDSIIHYLSEDVNDEQLKTLMTYHLKRGQYQQAEALLAQAPNLRWTNDYVDVISIVVEALKDTTSADAVIAANETTLLAVANEHSAEAYLAQSVLEAYDMASFSDIIVMPGSQPRSMKTKKEKESSVFKRKSLASVHPNPTRDMAYLNWKLPEGMPSHEVSISVYSMHGQPLMVDFLNAEVGIREINTANWAPGLYLLQLRHDERLIESIRFEVIR